MTYESLADGGFATGTMLGSGGFIVMDESASIVHNLYTFTRFYHHESCGQCSPCREGTGWMEKILHKILDGHGTSRTLICYGIYSEKLKEIRYVRLVMLLHGLLPVPSGISGVNLKSMLRNPQRMK